MARLEGRLMRSRWSIRLGWLALAAGLASVLLIANVEGSARYKQSAGGVTSAAAGDGLTFDTGTLDNNLITGKAGGQTIFFDTASGAATGAISSTSHATKGEYYLAASQKIVVDDVNNRLYVGDVAGSNPANRIEINSGAIGFTGGLVFGGSGAGIAGQDDTLYLIVSGGQRVQVKATNITFTGAYDIVLDATTGTKVGTATTQKLSFWNATPVVQGAAVADASGGATIDAECRTAVNTLLARMRTYGLIAP